jgi:hypothetical protein
MSQIHCQKYLTLLVALFAGEQCAAQNPIYDALINRGIVVSPQETLKLPPPILADGLNAAAQRKTIEKLLNGRYDWDDFTRRAVVSPILLKIADDDPSAGQLGRRVDLYFVTYGSLDKLGSENFLTDHLNIAAADNSDKEGKSAKLLSNDDLAKRNLPSPQQPTDPRWIATDSALLDKVRISATTQNVKTQTSDSVTIASVLDSKFDQDAEYPNTWRPITVDDAGHRQVGAPQPYAGLGSYIKVTRLAEPTGALFIEYHVAFAEPQGWFHGANLLRSKLPIVAQDMVRTLRRYLEKQQSDSP